MYPRLSPVASPNNPKLQRPLKEPSDSVVASMTSLTASPSRGRSTDSRVATSRSSSRISSSRGQESGSSPHRQLTKPAPISSNNKTRWLRSPSSPALSRTARRVASPSPSSASRKTSTNNHPTPNRAISCQDIPTKKSYKDNDVVVDVLPSFEMYNSLHRHIPQGNVDPDIHELPPSYNATQNHSESTLSHNNTSTSLEIQPLSTHSNSNINMNLNTLVPLHTQHLNIQNGSSTNNSNTATSSMRNSISEDIITPASNVNSNNDIIEPSPCLSIEDDINNTGQNVYIDKLYSLPKLTTPVQIEIHVTKAAAIPHEVPQEESILKEYTSGDIIHGYCIIENKSTQPLKFEMFYVTLEAYISVIDKQRSKRTLKRFLRMVDLSASWSYTNIILSSGATMVAGDLDHDDCLVGLNNSRILEPGKRYKKFFMFKLPNQMLDSACKQDQFSHCLLPPSFGIDKYRGNGQYSSIKINTALGCGHIGVKGSPILTNDHCDENLSINYTVDARIVGKDKKTSKLIIMKEQSYNLRVIPFSFSKTLMRGERSPQRQMKDLMLLVEERLSALESVFKRLEKTEPLKSIDIHSTDISGTIHDQLTLTDDDILQRKSSQLYATTSNPDSNSTIGLNKKFSGHMNNSRKNLPSYDSKENNDMIESEINYKLKPKILNTPVLKNSILSSLWGNNNTSNSSNTPSNSDERCGMIVVTGEIPQRGLPYWSPSLLRKSNTFQTMTKHAQENFTNLNSLMPLEETKIIKNINLKLTCIQSNNSMIHNPPEISSVTAELVCITTKSDNSIPITLNHEMLINNEKLMKMKDRFSLYFKKVGTYAKKFEDNKAKLNELYSLSRLNQPLRELKYTDFISSQLYNDVESLANIKVDIKSLPNIFVKQTNFNKSQTPISITPTISWSNTNAISPKKSSNDKISNEFSGLKASKTISTLESKSSSNHNSNDDDDMIRPTSSTNTASILRPSKSNSHQSPVKSSPKRKTAPSLPTSSNSNSLSHSYWKKTGDRQYERDVTIDLEISKDSKDTLVPDFQSCLCARFYLLRVNIKFDHHVGHCVIEIPISVKTLRLDQ
ncbi:hypothetical protein TBLA_0B03210 [Henningerozyma blattae CBS 6284]|uniref:Bul1 N-terminal domain-containing protein n=1 Tax=Henningerozyma blattae (strain ATCC 34711 / CBS 6284 / DSM 70876 / NBRC 10599 / NRRL Y-10934 / UCD 77-7) TaxID=1071380 RepID=I2GYG0_HENB6|nr:hypothetical protein TBLA_0B03210 [Tetrapisispora blattae CBS 6284]CCH59162.1 hypothetical protein TBLA_0B03210 [Tetrapisispora blattae CBS 6284]